MKGFKEIEKDALGLSFEDRAKLADVLLFSLDLKSLEAIEKTWTSEAVSRDNKISVDIERNKTKHRVN